MTSRGLVKQVGLVAGELAGRLGHRLLARVVPARRPLRSHLPQINVCTQPAKGVLS